MNLPVFLNKDIFKSSTLLFSGSVLSYFILFLGSIPILRIYGPEEYGHYAALLSLTSILGIPSTGQIHHALFLEEDSAEINKLLSVVFLFFIVTAILGLAGLAMYDLISGKVPGIYYVVVPVFQIIGTLQTLIISFAIKSQGFRQISIYKITNAILYVLVGVSIGLVRPKLIGLIAGYVISYTLALIYLMHTISDARAIYATRLDFELKNFIKYKKYIQFTLPGELVNTTMTQVPILWVNHFFGAANTGYFKFATKILSIPVDLIANSLGAIFKNKASLELKSAGHAKESFQGTFVLLALSGLIVFTGLFLTADTLIPWLWGEEWSSAGALLKTLLILYFFKYSIGPLTYIAQLASKQKEMFLINILVAVSILTGFFISYSFSFELIPTLWTYTCFFCFSSLITLMYSRKFSQ